VNGASRISFVILAAIFCVPDSTHAVGWRSTWDMRYRTTAFRGFELDSIPVSEVVTLPDGSLVTPDGIAVRIPPGSSHAMFFRPGPARRIGPLSTSFDGVAWGFGVQGVSVHAAGRITGDFGKDEAPGTDPNGRLDAAYVEWAGAHGIARAGRMHETSRLGFLGYDGARAEGRLAAGRIAVAAYGGWGLVRGDDIPATSAAVAPLGDFLPEKRQIAFGTRANWQSSSSGAGWIYQREIDPRADDFVSERTGAEGFLNFGDLNFSGGADYDIASRAWGRAEAKFAYLHERDGVEVGWRRYAPHFPLWTIWGAFSPVPYDAFLANARIVVLPAWEIFGSGERWDYQDLGATTPFASVEESGWRWSLGARWFPNSPWQARASLWREFGPGAGSVGYEGSAGYQWKEDISVSAAFSWMRRPLELRFDESKVASSLARLTWNPKKRFRAFADIQYIDEARERPDAAAFDWTHWHASLGTTLEFDSGDGSNIPPAVLRIPELPE
jgi:hypothetical protein